MEQFPFGTFPAIGKRGLPFQKIRLSRELYSGTNRKSWVPFTTGISGNFWKIVNDLGLPLGFSTKLSYFYTNIADTSRDIMSNVLANCVIFSTLRHTDPHAVRGRTTLKDRKVKERTFRNGSSRELKVAKE